MVILIQEKYQNYRLFLHKNGKKQGFERKIIVKTLLLGYAYFLCNQIVKNMEYR
jgi:hypothetical protein